MSALSDPWRTSVSPSTPDFDSLNVLIVEDEWVIARETVKAFEQAGARILGPVGTVAQALDLIRQSERIDAAVLDINLHGELAYPVAEALKARDIRYVFATGYDGAVIPAAFHDVVRCEKPVDPRRVAKALLENI